MTRQKKSRKVGQIGIRKQETRPSEKKETRRKKAPKGQKSGTRNSLVLENEVKDGKVTGVGKKDKKHGSKKKIELVAPVKVEQPKQPAKHIEPSVKLTKVKQPELTPEQELAALEQDAQLLDLVERVEQGELLTGKDAKYFNRHMARYDELVELLGLDDEDEEDDDDDLLGSLGGDEWDDLIDKG